VVYEAQQHDYKGEPAKSARVDQQRAVRISSSTARLGLFVLYLAPRLLAATKPHSESFAYIAAGAGRLNDRSAPLLS